MICEAYINKKKNTRNVLNINRYAFHKNFQSWRSDFVAPLSSTLVRAVMLERSLFLPTNKDGALNFNAPIERHIEKNNTYV